MPDNFGDKKNTNGFDKNPQNINRKGRRPKLVSHINNELKQQGYDAATKGEIVEAYLTMLNLPLSLIKKIGSADNDDYPLIYKLVAKEMMGKRGFEMLEKLLDRAIGKAQQALDITTDGDKIKDDIDYSKLSTEVLIEIANARKENDK